MRQSCTTQTSKTCLYIEKYTHRKPLKEITLIELSTHTTHTMTSFDNNLPIKPADFNPAIHIPYARIKAHNNGGKYIWAKAKVKAPTMRLAFDANMNEDDQTGKKKYDISLSFMGADTDSKIKAFQDMCDSIDTYNVDWATQNSVELWGEDLTGKRMIVEDRYTNMVRMPKKVEYSPTLKVKLMTNFTSGKNEFQVFSNVKDSETGEFPEIEIWDEENGMNLDVFKAKTSMMTLIEYTGMWVVGKKLYPSWKLVQCQCKSAAVEKKFALDDSDDEGDQATAPVEDREEDFQNEQNEQFSED